MLNEQMQVTVEGLSKDLSGDLAAHNQAVKALKPVAFDSAAVVSSATDGKALLAEIQARAVAHFDCARKSIGLRQEREMLSLALLSELEGLKATAQGAVEAVKARVAETIAKAANIDVSAVDQDMLFDNPEVAEAAASATGRYASSCSGQGRWRIGPPRRPVPKILAGTA